MVDAAPGLLLSIADIARRKGVSKQAVSKRVARLQLRTYDGPRGARLVSLAEYDRAVGETSDLAHAQADTPPPPAYRGDDEAAHVYTREQAREKAYAADLKKLDLDERLGKLVPAEDAAKAALRVAETVTRQLEQMAGRADDIAAAVARDGAPGARAFLKTLAREMREAIARELDQLAASAQAEHDASGGAS